MIWGMNILEGIENTKSLGQEQAWPVQNKKNED